MSSIQNFTRDLCIILVEQGKITQDKADDLQNFFEKSSIEAFTDFLIEEDFVDKSTLLGSLSTYYKVPDMDVVGYFFDPFLVHKFPKDILLRNEIVPLEVDENVLIVVAANPNDPELLNIIGNYVSYDVRFFVGLAGDICDAVKEFYDESLTEIDEDDLLVDDD